MILYRDRNRKSRQKGEQTMGNETENLEKLCGILFRGLSECGLAALLLDPEDRLLCWNRTAEELLEDTETRPGARLPEFLQPLGDELRAPALIHLGFAQYLLPENILHLPELPDTCRVAVFRDGTDAYLHQMLLDAVNKMNEALIICDEEDRIIFCNNSLLRMDSLVLDDVLGENVADVYNMDGGKECKIPQVRKEKKSHLNHRQYYSTKYGKKITTVSSTFPVLHNKKVIGTYNLLEDWSAAGTLQRQVYELQEQLLHQQGKRKKKGLPAASAKYHFRDIQYNSDIMRTAIDHCEMAAQTDAAVMLYGETGTGKELFAQSIHNDSPRAAYPFLAINCAAIPASLLESTLFGTVKGAFTGADDHPGLFEQADGGTLLLDELNSMDISLQAKLLRVLQEGTVRRVGGDREIDLDVRIIAILNIPPQDAIAKGRLRQDLYYRLATVYVTIPPLRSRGRDLFLLAQYFIAANNRELMKNVRDLSPETKAIFTSYSWPGNVRELQHCITHAMSIIPYEAEYITPQYLPEHIWKPAASANDSRMLLTFPRPAAGSGAGAGTDSTAPGSGTNVSRIQGLVGGFEQDAILQALIENEGNVTRAADLLGLSRQSLQYRIRKYGIDIREIKHRTRL